MLAEARKQSTQPPLIKIKKKKYLEWVQRYLKQDFQSVLFRNEYHATLSGPDGWSSGWLALGTPVPTRFRRQLGGDRIFFWSAIVAEELVGPF